VYHPGHNKAFSATLVWESFNTVTPYRLSAKWNCRPATAFEVVYNLAWWPRFPSKFLGLGSVSKDCRETFSDFKVWIRIGAKLAKISKLKKTKKKFRQYLENFEQVQV
jgi:hypothetical protein